MLKQRMAAMCLKVRVIARRQSLITLTIMALIPAVSSERRVVDGYVRVGPNRWLRRGDVSGV